MAQHVSEPYFSSGNCFRDVQVDDANELLDLGLGQYMLDFTPDTLYAIEAGCGSSCKDENGKTWTNCAGFSTKNSKNKGFIIAFIILVIAVAAYLYFNKK